MTDAIEKIRKCRIKLLYKEPFFAHLCMHLELKGMPKWLPKSYQSMGVDFKGNLYYSDDYVKGLSDDELIAVLCHEVMHLALEHLIRKGSRDAVAISPSGPVLLWNIAVDMVVNHTIYKYGFHIKNGVGNPYNLNLDKMSAEQVYDKLQCKMKKIECPGFDFHGYPQKNGQNGQKCGAGAGGKNKGKKQNGYYTQKEIEQARKKWRKALVDATTIAKQKGNLPAELQRLVDDTIEPKMRWKELLWMYITNQIPFDFTYSRPSKKSISSGFYMPSTLRESIDIVVAVDTSGSISDKQFSQFIAEMITVSRSFRYVNMSLIVCDCTIKSTHDFNGNIEDEVSNVKFLGHGGTDFRPVFKWIEDNKPNCKVLLYMTDGYGDFPKTQPRYTTIWVLTGEYDVPFGQKVILDVED